MEQSMDGCFFYRAEGHQKKQCTNYHAWRAKKGTLLNLVYSEVNLTSVPRHTWQIDSGATTHINVSMQGCLSYRRPSNGERYINIRDVKLVEVKIIGTFRLLLKDRLLFGFERHFCCTVFQTEFGFCFSIGQIWILLFIWKWKTQSFSEFKFGCNWFFIQF